jgi:hypothetical protein
LLADLPRLTGMATAMKALGKPDASRRIAQIAIQLARTNS